MAAVYKLGLPGGVVQAISVRRWTECLSKSLKQSALTLNNKYILLLGDISSGFHDWCLGGARVEDCSSSL
eukprot:scaffold14677_cov90-Skeletonema_dohrnii-CCMP3373.AAC.1